MTFDPIAAYSHLQFRYYWKKILSDPGFKKILESIRANIPQGQDVWVDRLKDLRKAADFHRMVQGLVDMLIKHTSTGLTCGGTHQPGFPLKHQGAVFLSNHRSTSLDTMVINHCLLNAHHKGTFNAAGDNIFRTPWLGHLIRLNRGFIVRRQIDDPDQKLVEADRLSLYINKLVRKGKWVWIAHRNGRSKDGKDLTDSSVLAMLRRGARNQEWGDLCRDMPFMPVAISWELIPLDLLMAQELSGIESTAHHSRDMHNIVGEIGQKKGRVHIQFMPRVQADKRNDLVKGLDLAIHTGMRLWESNWLAWLRLNQDSNTTNQSFHTMEQTLGASINLEQGAWVLDRGRDLDPQSQAHLLAMYAAPVTRQLELFGSLEAVLAHQAGLVPG